MTDDRLSIVRDFVRTTSTEAWHLLRRSEQASPMLFETGRQAGRRKLLLWRDAEGFIDLQPLTLTVFQPFGEASPVLRKAVWQRKHDFRMLYHFSETRAVDALPDPSATITISDTPIDGDTFDEKLREAFGLQIPIAWSWHDRPMRLTTDTGSVGFEFFDAADPPTSIRCKWAVDLPPEWQAVSGWFERMFLWLEDRLQES